jgi:hypothetical protein
VAQDSVAAVSAVAQDLVAAASAAAQDSVAAASAAAQDSVAAASAAVQDLVAVAQDLVVELAEALVVASEAGAASAAAQATTLTSMLNVSANFKATTWLLSSPRWIGPIVASTPAVAGGKAEWVEAEIGVSTVESTVAWVSVGAFDLTL